MKQNTHPDYHEVNVTCSCGNKFVTKSSMEKENFNIEVCSQCHPFYTGTQKIVDTTGRVDKAPACAFRAGCPGRWPR